MGNKTQKKYKNKSKKHKKRHNKTQKKYKKKNIQKKYFNIFLKSKTPDNIQKLSNEIKKNLEYKNNDKIHYYDLDKPQSYSPSINDKLVTLKSIPRKKLSDCNSSAAFQLKEPLQIGIPGFIYGKTCYPYDSIEAKKYLLKNLEANKHVNPDKIVPPIQNESNCWFNTMFVSFFISDKGRKFFHFFRQLMIEGKNVNGKKIEPSKLRDAFALFNFAIDSSLLGNKFAYEIDTNNIIKYIYENIPSYYKNKLPYLTNEKYPGNPIYYYSSIIYYLHDSSIHLITHELKNSNWKDEITKKINKNTQKPDVIVFEIFDDYDSINLSSKIINKPTSFYINPHTHNSLKYSLDSCIIRDTNKKHFCANITCNKKEMGYDGASFNRIVPFSWKKYINSNYEWSFEGTVDSYGKDLTWNFLNGYQMLIYYRVK